MNVIAKRTLLYYIEKYPDAKTALLTWYYEIQKVSFANFNELKEVYGHASIVSGSRVIFNIKGNSYRLIAAVNFRKDALYVIWFGPHEAYDRIDSATVQFNGAILNFKTK